MSVLTSKRVKLSQNDFSGGQNSGTEPASIAQTQAVLLQNSIITQKGRCTERLGITRSGSGPYEIDSYTKLLLHCDGTDDGTTFTDAIGTHTVTAVNAVTSVDQYKFGGSAGYFDGTGDYLTVPDHADFNLGSGDFTVDTWGYFSNVTGIRCIFSQWGAAGNRTYDFVYSAGALTLYYTTDGTNVSSKAFAWTPTVDTWYYIELGRSGNNLYCFINGTQVGSTADLTGVTFYNSTYDFQIGIQESADNPFLGYIDEFRVSKGICRHSAAFTPPTEAYSTAAKILGLTHYEVGSTIDTPIRAIGTEIQRLNSTYTGWDTILGLSSLTTGLTTNFVQALDKLFVLNGTDHVFSIASNLAVTDEGNTNTDPPLTTVGEWTANNRLFLSGSKTASLRDYVWFSNALDPQTFDRSTNVFKVRSGGRGSVTWLKMFKEFELIVYKNDAIFVLDMSAGTTPLTDWQLKPLSTVVGCPAGRTVQDIGNDHIFLANDGVRLLSRTSFDKLRVGIISEPIQDIIDDINQDAIETACGWFENGLYILGIPTGTSTYPDRFLIWDSIAANRNGDPNSAWTTIPKGTWNLSCFSSFGFGDNSNTVIGGSATANSYVYKVLNGTTDNGTAITQRIVTRQQDFDEPFIQKIFDPVQFIADGGSDALYLVEMQIDDAGWLTVGTIDLTGQLQTPFITPQTTSLILNADESFRTKFGGKGKYVQFRITNSESGTIPTFLEYAVYAKPYIGRIS